mmetsp:Transcript_44305/g.70961  ORF Transcript_44305/g.70961 Transcript_44305/m.70961 type:complete len:203 (-) Transcript_44305:767-1375(-)
MDHLSEYQIQQLITVILVPYIASTFMKHISAPHMHQILLIVGRDNLQRLAVAALHVLLHILAIRVILLHNHLKLLNGCFLLFRAHAICPILVLESDAQVFLRLFPSEKPPLIHALNLQERQQQLAHPLVEPHVFDEILRQETQYQVDIAEATAARDIEIERDQAIKVHSERNQALRQLDRVFPDVVRVVVHIADMVHVLDVE